MLAIFEDYGPAPMLNISNLDEGIAAHLSVTGMTIVGFGSTDRIYLRLFGSIPVPNLPECEALPFLFLIKGDDSEDSRVQAHGRDCAFFLIFDSSNRSQVYGVHTEAEKLMINYAQNIRSREDLTPEALQTMLDAINQITPSEAQESPSLDQVPVEEVKAGLEFITVLPDGEIQSTSLVEGIKSSVLLVINHVNQMLLILYLDESIPDRHRYWAGRIANRLNGERFRSAFKIRDIEDPLEIDMLLEKLHSSLNA